MLSVSCHITAFCLDRRPNAGILGHVWRLWRLVAAIPVISLFAPETPPDGTKQIACSRALRESPLVLESAHGSLVKSPESGAESRCFPALLPVGRESAQGASRAGRQDELLNSWDSPTLSGASGGRSNRHSRSVPRIAIWKL